jgi:outer membrane protein assembly factor BamB
MGKVLGVTSIVLAAIYLALTCCAGCNKQPGSPSVHPSAAPQIPGSTPQAGVTASTDNSAWPMADHDAQHTRRSPVKGPATPKVKWTCEIGSENTSPVISEDGTIYIQAGAYDDHLCAINPDGSIKWDNKISRWGISAAIGTDGTVYVASDEHTLSAIDPDGNLKWSYTTGGSIDAPPVIGTDGTVYIGNQDHKLYAINPDGTLRWAFKAQGPVGPSPAISTDGTLYVHSYGLKNKLGKLYSISSTGRVKWKNNITARLSPAIGMDGTIYADWGLLYAYNPYGTLKWRCEDVHAICSPAIGIDGTVYAGDGRHLCAIGPDGKLNWTYKTKGEIRISPPIIDANGTVYVGSDNSSYPWATYQGSSVDKLYAFNPDGSVKWVFATGDAFGPAAIGPDGTLYAGCMNGKLYAIGPGGG